MIDGHPCGVFSWQPPAELVVGAVGSARRGKAGGMTVADVELAVGASGLLRTFNEAGVLDVADVHVAQRICRARRRARRAGGAGGRAGWCAALRGGSVCVDLATVAADVGVAELPWPEPAAWLAAVRASPLLGEPPVLRLYDDRLLYLDRYWREEKQVCDDLLALSVSRRDSRRARLRATFPAGFRRAARSGGNRAVAGGYRADRWTGHRQDHHGRAAAGAAGRAGRAGGRAAAADRVGGADRQGGGAAAGGGASRGRQARCGRPGPAGRPAGDDAAPAAGQPAGLRRRGSSTIAATGCRTT